MIQASTTNYHESLPDAVLQALWVRMQQNDPDAFRQLYDATVISLSNQCHRVMADADAVQDILQEVYCSLYRRCNSLPGNLNIGGYLYRAMRYGAAKHLRDQMRRERQLARLTQISDTVTEDYREDLLDDTQLRQQVWHAISSLPEKCRQAFLLSHYQQKSNKSVAAEMGISVKTVEKHISKALRMLRQELGEEYLIHCTLVLLVFYGI
jgi:RNA polymerase sigma-70 factor (ECF subfamily)